jgi:hypothetical protein
MYTICVAPIHEKRTIHGSQTPCEARSYIYLVSDTLLVVDLTLPIKSQKNKRQQQE